MRLIHGPLSSRAEYDELIPLKVDRLRLAKRRWRAFADDGAEFGFDLECPLRDKALFHQEGRRLYVIEQLREAVIELPCPSDSLASARLGWMLGNLHFPIEIREGFLRVGEDPAVRQMLARECIEHTLTEAVFQPLSGAHSHGV